MWETVCKRLAALLTVKSILTLVLWNTESEGAGDRQGMIARKNGRMCGHFFCSPAENSSLAPTWL